MHPHIPPCARPRVLAYKPISMYDTILLTHLFPISAVHRRSLAAGHDLRLCGVGNRNADYRLRE